LQRFRATSVFKTSLLLFASAGLANPVYGQADAKARVTPAPQAGTESSPAPSGEAAPEKPPGISVPLPPLPKPADASPSAGNAPLKKIDPALADILARVESHASALGAAEAEHEASKAATRAALAQFLGEIDGFVQDIHFDHDRLVNPLSPPINISAIPVDRNQFAPGIEIALPIDINGKIRHQVRAARYREWAADADVADIRLQILNSAAGLYRAIQQVVGIEEALAAQRKALEAHLEVATKGVEVGRIAPVERFRLASEVESVNGRLATVRGTRAALGARLAALMRVEKLSREPGLPRYSPVISGASLSASDRPDLQAARLQVEAAAANQKGARAERLPRLAVVGQLEHNTGYDAPGDTTWFAGVRLSMPFWDGGRRRAQVREAAQQREVARRNEEKLIDEARAEVVAGRAAWRAAETRESAARSGLAYAAEAARIQAKQFEDGRLSATDLIDSESALANARAEHSSSLTDWWKADDDLNLALGLPPSGYQSTEIRGDHEERYRSEPPPSPKHH